MVQAIKCEMSFFLLLFTSLWKWWTNEVNNNSASRSPWLPRLWDPKFRILSNLAMGRTNLSGLFLSFQAFHSCPTNLLGASLNGTNLFQKDIPFDITFKILFFLWAICKCHFLVISLNYTLFQQFMSTCKLKSTNFMLINSCTN